MSYKDGEEVSVLFDSGLLPYFVIGNQPNRGGKLVLKKIKTRGWDTSEYPDLLIIESEGRQYDESRWRKTGKKGIKNKKLSGDVKEILQEKNINQKELADMCGVTESAISHYLAGRRLPSRETLRKIARALGVAEHVLLFGRDG